MKLSNPFHSEDYRVRRAALIVGSPLVVVVFAVAILAMGVGAAISAIRFEGAILVDELKYSWKK